MTINRKHISDDYITFEDYKACAMNVGQHMELPMGGPYTAKRFVVSSVERHPTKHDMVTCFARAVVSYKAYDADVVAGTIKKCGSVVAYVVFDEVCDLYYVQGEDINGYTTCNESLQEAMRDYFK